MLSRVSQVWGGVWSCMELYGVVAPVGMVVVCVQVCKCTKAMCACANMMRRIEDQCTTCMLTQECVCRYVATFSGRFCVQMHWICVESGSLSRGEGQPAGNCMGKIHACVCIFVPAQYNTRHMCMPLRMWYCTAHGNVFNIDRWSELCSERIVVL